jgi:hypothetical protein
MAFLVGGANSAADTGYDIDNSLRGDDGSSTALTKSFDSAGNRRTFTVSAWVKFGKCPQFSYLAGSIDSGSDYCQIGFANNGQIRINQGDNSVRVATKALFRDASAWYHVVFAIDTTDSTESNRVKIYVNGTLQDVCRPEAFTTAADYPTQNLDLFFNNTYAFGVGSRGDVDASFDGYISDFYFLDGQAKAASVFGETNDNGVWIPKDPTDVKENVTFGNNGFLFEFKQTGTDQDASGIGADTSGEDNHFAVTNLAATDQCTDTPTNNFATFNPLIKSTNTYSEGNTLVSMDSSADSKTTSTIGVSKGKWYMEFLRNDNDYWPVGIAGSTIEGAYVGGASTDSLSFWAGLAGGSPAETVLHVNGSQIDDPWNATTWADGDVVALLLNADDEEISLYKNNSIVGSAYDYSGLNWSQVFFALGNYVSGNSYKTNFGNPSFTISSGNADANGYGNFEHAPPNGYYALCTKNLAEYG